jgi:hypothetical protein
LEPEADHTGTTLFAVEAVKPAIKMSALDLPPKLRMNIANRTSEVTKYHGTFKKKISSHTYILFFWSGLYGRINGKGHFKTAMTTVAPNAKGGVLLHPTVSTRSLLISFALTSS